MASVERHWFPGCLSADMKLGKTALGPQNRMPADLYFGFTALAGNGPLAMDSAHRACARELASDGSGLITGRFASLAIDAFRASSYGRPGGVVAVVAHPGEAGLRGTTMIVELAYSRGTLAVNLPDECDVQVLRKVPVRPLADPPDAIQRAYAQPVGAPPLTELARGKSSACILICDITRPVPNGLILPPMVRALLDAGIEASRITVLVATGLHRPNEGDELRELVGSDWVLDTVAVENHFARNDDDHVDMGVTATRGTPVKLDRRFVDAELRIVTGLVEPHFMAGFSGGRKVISPGIAHQDTIRTFHSARFMEDPGAVQCNLDGNPLHEEQLEILRMLGGEVWAVNTVLDEERNTTFVNFGEILQSHAQAVDYVRRSSSLPVARKFNTVVTSAAGFPLDATYYQTVKGMVMPMDILEPGADLIIAAACSEGIGSAEFRAAQERLIAHGVDGFRAQILAKQFADVDEWQTEMQLKPMRVANIHLYTDGLNAADRAITGVNMIDSIEAAVRASMARSADNSVAVIPEGPYVVPFHSPQIAAA